MPKTLEPSSRTYRGTGRFSESSWWLCWPPHGRVVIISGTLAEVLVFHIEYGLKFIGYDDDALRHWHSKVHLGEQCHYCDEVRDAVFSR